MVNLRKCINCGKLFSPETDSELCSACGIQEDHTLETAQQYLEDHPVATLEELGEKTKMPFSELLKYFRENKLVLKGKLSDSLVCELCDKPLASGRFCDDCAAETSQALKDAFSKKTIIKKRVLEKQVPEKPEDEKMTAYHGKKRS